MENARALCVEALIRVEQAGAYSNIALDQLLEREGKARAQQPDSHWRSEAAFASALFYGVLERKLTLDYCINQYAARGISGMACAVLQILRTSFYQLLFMPNIPERAVVDEAVKLTRTFRQGCASGFVNGMLRAFIRGGKAMPHADDPLEEQSILYSLPIWMLKEWRDCYGEEEAEQIASAFNRRRPFYARANLLRNSAQQLCAMLGEQLAGRQEPRWNETTAEPDSALEGCVRLSGLGNLRQLPAFRQGRFHIQDKSSQLCALSLGARPGERVLDLCAAPGGKSFTIAQAMAGEGLVAAFDLHPQRVKLIREGAARLGLENVQAGVRDALIRLEGEYYDRVLCDVPCSGLGILGRKPEIRYKSPEEFLRLPETQFHILENAAAAVKPGGILVYSTCTLRQEENHQVTEKFLALHPEFQTVPLPECCGEYAGLPGEITLFPHRGDTDGFYLHRMRRAER